jgi:hypothetical protein
VAESLLEYCKSFLYWRRCRRFSGASRAWVETTKSDNRSVLQYDDGRVTYQRLAENLTVYVLIGTSLWQVRDRGPDHPNQTAQSCRDPAAANWC